VAAERSEGASAAGGGPDADEQVGSVGEEATKLLHALQDWARDRGSEHADGHHSDGHHSDGHDADEHQGAGTARATAADCRYCPVCGVIAVVRATPPEVRAHLASAAGSLVQAAAELLATTVPDQRRQRPEPPAQDEGDGSWD
jgi:hypothetical protein